MKTQITLGQFIFLLSRLEPDTEVRYDFCLFSPTIFDSYRGDYSHLGLGVTTDYIKTTAEELKKAAELCIGKTFQGYKGGDYVATENTPLWASNWGDWSQTAIIGVTDNGIIETAHID